MHHIEITSAYACATHIYMSPVVSSDSSVLLGTVFFIVCLSCFLLPASSLNSTPLQNEPDTDLQTLLCLKHHLSGTSRPLASWKNDSLQHCSWTGVSCSKRHTSRVVALNLESFDLNGQIPSCIANLTFLARLHMANNQLNGQIPTELGQLNRLQYLNLSSNDLSGVIPSTISSCSRLQIIDLGGNAIQGEIPSNLSHCSNLQKLILRQNGFSGVIPESLGMLRNLSLLHLAQNSLTGNIPLSLGYRSSLRAVVLANNRLTGPIPPFLSNSSSLQYLDLTENSLGGVIPYALLNSMSLKTIGLALNNFVGPIPDLSQTDSPLQYLILQSNNLIGPIPSSLGNLSSLIWLSLGNNRFQGSVPTSISRIPNLQLLGLTNNMLSGPVPASIYNMSALTYLGIGNNGLVGEIPYTIGYTLSSIQTLILKGNQFHGEIPASLANATNIMVIDLEYNAFYGTIPSLGTLPNLEKLNLGMNQLEAGDWSFLSSLANCTRLVRLSLSSNKIQGTLPSSIGGLPKSLEVLLFAENSLCGKIPIEIGDLTNLTALYMESNMFTGSLPDTIGNLSRLSGLSVSQNKLSGQIPLSIRNLGQLSELYLQDNNFSGPIPAALGYYKNLETLNLSCNNLDGGIPKQLFTLSSLTKGLDLSHNQLSGQIPLEIGGLINLDLLNISHNKLSGQIPSTIGQCVHLEFLHMEGNLLEGKIPESFAELRGIIELDLSQNNLSGEIPELFESFSYLNLLNLSFNSLEGPVPTGAIFHNKSVVYIQGNKNLCGSTPLLQLPLCDAKASRQNRSSKILKVLGLSALSLLPLSCLLAAILLKKRNKVKRAAHPSCKELKTYSYAELVRATNNFSSYNLVGSGKSGSVYRGRFESEEHAVAIKVFKLDQLGTPKSFLAECEALRNTRHRNLVKVITACSTFDPSGHQFKALILEYMPNGSLESWLYPNLNENGLEIPLSFASRITIATDIACALDYLHNHCTPRVVHCDLKPGNVLLDDVMGARLADFGLAKFLRSFSHSCHHSSTSLLGPRGSIGYIAPEYGFGSKPSTEGDVYSYGIIILEMLTRKRPTDEMFTNGLNLHRFVKNAFPQKICEVLDPCIVPISEYGDVDHSLDHGNDAIAGAENCILHLMKLGLSCSMETPKDRPAMQDVYAEVITIKEAFAALHMIE